MEQVVLLLYCFTSLRHKQRKPFKLLCGPVREYSMEEQKPMEEQTPRPVSRGEMVESGELIEGKVLAAVSQCGGGFHARKWRLQHTRLAPSLTPPFPPRPVRLPPPPVLADFWMHDVRLCFCSTVAQGADYLAVRVFGRGKDDACCARRLRISRFAFRLYSKKVYSCKTRVCVCA